MQVLDQFIQFKKEGRKAVAMLVDPDRIDVSDILAWEMRLVDVAPDFIFVGGSLVNESGFGSKLDAMRQAVERIQGKQIPLVLFPGSPTQLHSAVDAVLFLSLISGRNPELLIGHHVVAAPRVKELGIEPIATGYMLIDGGVATTASYISNTQPIPRDKPGIAVSTAMAGEMLGLRTLYLDAGSGAPLPVPTETIQAVAQNTNIPIIVGGGMRNRAQIEQAFEAGADIAVVGTALENEPELIASLVK